jgi:hypothetical protein
VLLKRAILIISFLVSSCCSLLRAQTLGGQTVFNFLGLPASPQLTALGGVNISNQSNDIGLSFNNPALLQPSMHTQMSLVFNANYAGIKNYHWMLGYYHPKLKTSFAAGISYLNYGNITQTDAIGNIQGSFRPNDYVAQISASKEYNDRFRFGITAKFIHSNYQVTRLSGVAADVGLLYRDTVHQWQTSIVVKNMGGLLGNNSNNNGDLPFDLQWGISKRLAKAPIQFSLTAHHLHQFDIRYNDTLFNQANGFNENDKGRSKTFDKLFRHIVFATQFYLGDKVEVTAAYNHLRRQDLNIPGTTNGLNGFSLGIGALFQKLQIRYARAYYQNNTAYNQLGINLQLNEYMGLGKFGKKIGW